MNVLLTCAGRRNYLVRFFREALGTRGRVLACDASDSAPAFVEADQTFTVPSMDHPDYFDALVAICRSHQVRLVVSVNDLELDGLAQIAPRLRDVGSFPVVASRQVIALCQDKWAAFQWLRSHEFLTPATWLTLAATRQALAQGAAQFPLLIKPRWGSSSIGIERVENECELELAYAWAKIQVDRSIFAKMSGTDADHSILIQEWVAGQEYGMDVVNDFDGNHVATLARRKLVMRVGNTDRAVTVVEPRLDRWGKALGQRLGHIGSLDCDVIATETGLSVLDLNPRLGGGYPFSHLAGANLPATLIAWAGGEQPDPAWLAPRAGVLASKYDDLVVMGRLERSTAEVRTLEVRSVNGVEAEPVSL